MSAAPALGPAEIRALSPEEADRLLDRLERTVPVRPPLSSIEPGPATEMVVFGDTHGDWRSTQEAVALWSAGGVPRILVGLGDYIDRSPDDCPAGSVVNALYLLSLAGRFPGRVVLLQGNHETVRRIPCFPQSLAEEIDELWGPTADRYERLLALLERGPLAAVTPNGVYLAHAGFPHSLPEPRWQEAFEGMDEERLSEVVWAECDVSRLRRGAAPAWGARQLDAFLSRTGLGVVVRGHDPDVMGRPAYQGRCLTLHTSRIYERYGGVLAAVVPLDAPLRSVAAIRIEHLPTEGRSYASDAD